MDHTAAAARLGVPESEVRDVLDEANGTVIVTTDGQSYIDVPADSPDADGKTGLMFLAAPSESYAGGFPVFTQEPGKESAPERTIDGAAEAPEGTERAVETPQKAAQPAKKVQKKVQKSRAAKKAAT